MTARPPLALRLVAAVARRVERWRDCPPEAREVARLVAAAVPSTPRRWTVDRHGNTWHGSHLVRGGRMVPGTPRPTSQPAPPPPPRVER